MENPVSDVVDVIHRLTQGSPKVQQDAVLKYFTPNASFTHPFCRTGSFDGSRWLVLAIFRWYKIMSPRIEIQVNSVAYDQYNLLLYINISQIFRIWAVPFYSAPVNLVTVLTLARVPGDARYYIRAQDDLYQTSEWIKFVVPFGVGVVLVLLWQFLATFFCTLGAVLGAPFTWLLQTWADDEAAKDRVANGEVSLSSLQIKELAALGGPAPDGLPAGEESVRVS